MPKLVVMGAQLQCNMGAAPMPLTVVPQGPPITGMMMTAATIMDNKPMLNIAPFGVCNSPGNPAAVAAKAAGATAPCTPATAAPWTPGAIKVTIGGKPALHDGCKLMCTLGGMISVTNPGQQKIDVT